MDLFHFSSTKSNLFLLSGLVRYFFFQTLLMYVYILDNYYVSFYWKFLAISMCMNAIMRLVDHLIVRRLELFLICLFHL